MDNQICTIERGDNGFIIRTSGDELNHTQVYEDKYVNALVDSNAAFMEAMKEVFRYVMDIFGVFNNKHDKKALSVEVVDRSDFPVDDTIADLKNTIADLQRDRDTFMKESIRLQVELDTLRQPKQSGSDTSGKVTLKIKDDGGY